MFSSASLRHWSGIYSESSYRRRANRTATSCVVRPPWLMLPPTVDGMGNIDYRFRRLLENKELHYTNKIGGGELQLPVDIDIIKDVEFVGSSNGWLALQNRRNYGHLFLSNPITGRHIKLPPPRSSGAAARLVLSADDAEADECLAFMTYSGAPLTLAFCSTRRSKKWTRLGHDDGQFYKAYDNIAYSTAHERLFCVYRWDTPNALSLECWDFHGDSPRRDWVIHANGNGNLHFGRQLNIWPLMPDWPAMPEFKSKCRQIKYLVCPAAEQYLFLVVRHVNPRVGPHGSMVDQILLSPDMGCLCAKYPYKTIDFDVYKIDPYSGMAEHMERSLEGLAMFVGINEPFAIPAAEVAGVKADCIYFTDENLLAEVSRLNETSYGGHDNGVFEYQNKEFYPCCDDGLYPVEYEKIRKNLPLPLWFNTTTNTTISE